MSAPTVSTRLAQIAEQSKREPARLFTTLAQHMDEDFLREAFHQLRKDAAAGIDQMTVAEYSQNADIAKFFDTIEPTHLRTILRRRVNDGAILRLIGMWLHVGVLEEGKIVRSEMGTPQGGVISPILANIFLHTVLDEWFEKTVRARMGGNCFLVRFADDFVMGYAFKGDAEKVFRVLPKRFERFGLSIHAEKSRLVQFSRPYWRQGKGPGTFAFLGFDHYWDKTRNGGWTIKRKTQGKRLRRFLSGLHEWCRVNRHLNIVEQYQTLKSKLRGHYQYYGVRGNYKMLEVVYEHAEAVWKR